MPPETPNNQNVQPGFIPPKETDDMKTPVAKPVVEAKVMPTNAEEAARAEELATPKPPPTHIDLPPEIRKPIPAPVLPVEVEPPQEVSTPKPTETLGADTYREIPELGTESVVAPSIPSETQKPTPTSHLKEQPVFVANPIPNLQDYQHTPPPSTVEKKPADPTQKKGAIRTLQGDIAHTVHSQNISVADIALAEQKRARADIGGMLAPQEDTSGKWWVLGTGLFILLGIGVVASIFYFSPREELPVVEGPQETLLFADERTVLDVAGMNFQGFANTVRNTLLVQGGPATIRGVSLVRVLGEGSNVRHISTEEFFTLLKSRAPARLTRSLLDGFVLGVATPTSNPSAFLLFKTNTYETAFAGMLEWESFIADDLPFITYTFGMDVKPAEESATSTDETATTTDATGTTTEEVTANATFLGPPATTLNDSGTSTDIIVTPPPVEPPPVAVFTDIVVRNKDVRALVYPDGTSRLMYTFADKETLLIAENKEVLSLLIDRLSTARFNR